MFLKNLLQRKRYFQYLSAFLASIAGTCCLLYSIWPSPLLPKLTSTNSPIGYTISAEEASWIVSSESLGALCGSCLQIFYAELLGRRTWLLISAIFLIIPGVMKYFAKVVLAIYVARFICGMVLALVFMIVPVYIAEISEKDIRGKLAAFVSLSAIAGKVFVMSAGPFLSYYSLTVCCIVLPSIFLVLFYFMPESPYYLLKIGNGKAALESLTFLSSKSSDSTFINQRFREIEDTVTYDMKNKSSIWEFIKKKDYRKSLVIILGVKGLFQLCGLHAFDGYAQLIIEQTNSVISPKWSSVLFGVIQLPAAVFVIFAIDNIGRKPLWILSAAGCALALFAGGLYFYLTDRASIEWIPTASLLLYFVMIPTGVGSLPFVIMGEIFPTNIKGAAASISLVYSSILGFGVAKCFGPIVEEFGMHVAFWIFAACCLLGICFIVFFVPETKGKSLEEIQIMLNKNRRVNNL